MGSSSILSEKDANNSLKKPAGTGAGKPEIKSLEHHRQVLKSKMEEEKYGHHSSTTNTNNSSTNSTTAGTSTSSPGPGPGPAIAVPADAADAAAKPPVSSSPQMTTIIHRMTRLGLPADPTASGACSSTHQYVSPSDNIMSPCTAKLNALKGRQAGKAKPKSLFAQASAKKFVGENVFGARNADSDPASSSSSNKSGDDNANQQQQQKKN
ncbi:hypothetical protein F4777DRAFT_527380 [Nemania sp. FL0916]|nr:hypothetical protein F4777DRAFT_527380 [Nemania sp. FL0916]